MIHKLSESVKSEVKDLWKGHPKDSESRIDAIKEDLDNVEYPYKKYSLIQRSIFRVVDIIGALLGIIILSPIIIVISLLITFFHGFPILFKQKRLGENGEKFTIYKFRSMHKNAEERLHQDEDLYRRYVNNDYKLTLKEDPRVTKIGKFIRKTSIDEIPQFFNVLKGDMSLVGPRPIVPKEIERYGRYRDYLLSVKPGITGIWQVSGRNHIDYPDRKYLDLIYIDQKSILLDIKILWKTIFVVIKKVGVH